MGRQRTHHAPGCLCPFGGRSPWTEATDRELLDHFVRHRDEEAFAVLLHRHGPMVLGVCRRLLRDAHAAEDAFQATFIVLARRAGTISWRDTVGDWLYQVARRTARKAAAAAALRQAHEEAAAHRRPTVSQPDLAAQELYAVLDEELQRLPVKYRRPVVLCCLERSTLAEAARQLGWPLGTLASRLARGRELLRGRLARRGFLCAAAALVLGEGANPLSAAVPAALTEVTLQAALESPRGVSLPAKAAARLARVVVRDLARARFRMTLVAVLCLTLMGTAAAATFPHCAHRPQATGEALPQTANDESPAPKVHPETDGPRSTDRSGHPLLLRHANLIQLPGVFPRAEIRPGGEANRTPRPVPLGASGRSPG
jgi:RNA polymerase sigma factor (sigma-70 family)